ncbi:hypothetical protein G6L94_00630 [Agrobacterium rhizogenes]|nr:hypothetical protein [Rhizobium rhizogenes]NTF50484.1 hypothetical protein [Rhizobium rhizogenes]NTF57120.1 hypothetical protein [Rhizobium rhizogenes]NTF70214.1 hypothetical protein [Rhizobium rhizogenes]NTF76702.1 hypothetical protein [Rhizobium rhizogenes]NTG02472.1 hypothetical protein [Rhizobium rhizogenes]
MVFTIFEYGLFSIKLCFASGSAPSSMALLRKLKGHGFFATFLAGSRGNS